MTHKGTIQLETPRLILRRFTQEDAQAMYTNWASDPEVVKHLTWPVHASVDATRELLRSWVAQYENENYYHWAMVPKDNNNAPVGGISVVRQKDAVKMVEIGYCLGTKWWGKGYTPEALKRLIAFFFEEVKVLRIAAEHDTRNPASGKVMEKCGMTHEGILRQADSNNQGICDNAVWSILAGEYYGS